MRKALLIAGGLFLLLGLVWPWIQRGNRWRHLGHLPGDIHVEREGYSFHFPLVTCLLLSGLLSLVIWLLRK